MTSVRKHLSVGKLRFYISDWLKNLFSSYVAASNLKWLVRVAETYYWSIHRYGSKIWEYGATNEVTSPKTLGTRLNSSMGKSAGKWASARPPLLPIKSYAAVESELMKEIEKLQHGRPCPPSWPFAHRITFPLIDFFFLPRPSPRPSVLYSFSLPPISFFRRKK